MSLSLLLRSRRCIIAVLWSALATAAPAKAEELSPQHRFVVRLSQATVQSLLADEVNERLPVREEISGVVVQGEAHVIGQPAVRLHESAGRASFDLVLKGTAASRTVGQAGPATIYSRSQTQFEAVRPVIFESSRGFSALDTTVAAKTQCFTEGIGTARQGVVGRVIQRRAAKKIAERKTETTEIARQRAELRIAQAVERRLDERLARLNWLLGFSETTGKPERSHWAIACSSTPEYLQVSLGQMSVDRTSDADELQAPPTAEAALAVCLHRSLLGPRMSELAARLSGSGKDEFFIDDAMTSLRREHSAAAALVALFSQTGLRLREDADWLVLELPMPTEQLASEEAHGAYR